MTDQKLNVTQFKIIRPDDFHVHLREGAMLENVLPHTAKNFARALVMPNLKNAIRSGVQAMFYRDEIRKLAGDIDFKPLMTIKLTERTSVYCVMDATARGVVAVKVYPEGVTTNSEDGVRDIEAIDPDVFRAMAANKLVLCVHAEKPGVFSLDREAKYLTHVRRIADAHPNLRIVLEHVSSKDAVDFVLDSGPNVAATITAHHLLITLDDVVGDRLNPHNFCKPIAKRPQDRSALINAATSGHKKFFLGTDSAPHSKDTKECSSGCAGCFTAPIAIPLLAGLFEQHNSLQSLEWFTSLNGALFYELQPNQGTVTIERHAWRVPESYGGVVPFMAGKTLGWRVVE